MTIRFMCGSCSTRIKVPDDYAGRKVKCPNCNITQPAPLASTAPGETPAASAAANAMTGVWEFDSSQVSSDLDALAAASQRSALTGQLAPTPVPPNPAPTLSVNPAAIPTTNPAQTPTSDQSASDLPSAPQPPSNGNTGAKVRQMPTPKPAAPAPSRHRTANRSSDQTTSSILSANWPRESRPARPLPAPEPLPQAVTPAPTPRFTALLLAAWALRIAPLPTLAAGAWQLQRLRAIEAPPGEIFAWAARAAVAALLLWAAGEACLALRHLAQRA